MKLSGFNFVTRKLCVHNRKIWAVRKCRIWKNSSIGQKIKNKNKEKKSKFS
jgi:hypothetical protein